MAEFTEFKLTSKGLNLLYEVQTGKTLKFTRFGLGDGELGSTSIRELTNLKHEILSREILKLEKDEDKVTIGFSLDKQEIEEGFYWREIGIFAENPDTQEEILFSYATAGETGDYISGKNSSGTLEKRIDVVILISDVENIVADINDSMVFATHKEVETLRNAVNNINLVEYAPRTKIVTLKTDKWTKITDNYYEYTIEDDTVTEETIGVGYPDIPNQQKLKNGNIITLDGEFKIITSKLPTQDITMNVVLQKTTSVTNQKPVIPTEPEDTVINNGNVVISETEPAEDCLWYKIINQKEIGVERAILQTEPYDENDTTVRYILNTNGELEKVINMTDGEPTGSLQRIIIS